MRTPEMLHPGPYESLGALLDDALLTFKSEVALIEVDRAKETKRWTYLDTRREMARVVALLEQNGIGPGDRVAVLMSNQARWLVAALAIFHRGAILVPLDYKLGAPEQRALLDHAKPKALISEHGLLRRFEALGPMLVLVSDAPASETYCVEPIRWESLPQAELTAAVPRARGDVASIVYSSGTGGRAKGCMLTHDAYLAQLEALMELFPMRPGHVFFSVLPTNHAIDFMVGFVGPFACGATVVHQRTLRPEHLRSTMKAYQPTHMALVPLLLASFEEAIDEQLLSQPKWARRAVSLLSGLNEVLTVKAPRHSVSRALLGPIHEAFGGRLELLFCGGAFVDRARAEKLYRLGLPVVIGYGLTECCTVATVHALSPFRADSVGQAVRGVEVRIHEPGPDGVGEVWIRGRTVMKGYLDDPELTEETITEEGWLRTGDLGWLDAAHHLHLVGRSKNMIVTAGGKNVYPEDIEGAFEGLPCEELCVFASGYLWPRTGKLEDERLVAVLRPRKGNGVAAPSIESVVEQLRDRNHRLPDFKRVHGVLTWTDPFPRTASMKVKRDVLARELRERAERDRIEDV